MNESVSSCLIDVADVPLRHTIQTTLYDLIATLSEEIRPELVTPVVLDLLNCGKITLPIDWRRFSKSLSTS